jgi:uncharacterized protein YdcH (DUF465 family)
LNEQYKEVDKAVIRLEMGVEHASDADLDAQKQKRVRLKDELYALLQA